MFRACFTDRPEFHNLISLMFSCIIGKVSERLGQGFCHGCMCSLLPVIHIIEGAITRQKIRHLHELEGTLTGDLLVWFFCPFCALTQEAQEIEAYTTIPGETRDELIERE